MAEESQPSVNDRFKAEMPQIPGVSGSGMSARPPGSGGKWLVIGGAVAVLVAVLIGGKLLSKPRQNSVPPAEVAPQIEVPVSPELPVPVAVDSNSPIAQVGDLAKPWDARQFTFHNKLTGENVPALLMRLPAGAASQSSGYWALAMRAAYGNCRLEYLQDADKASSDYGYTQARHPL